MRKILSILLCLTMLLSMALPAFAKETVDPAPQNDQTTVTTPPPAPAAPETTPPEQTTPPPTQCSHSWDAGSGTDATCTQAGTKTFTCTLCGGTKTETTPARGHSFGGWSQVDGASHKRSCSVCGTEESGAHSLTSAVTTEATCVAKGVKTHTCSGCGYSYTEEIPATGKHAYGEWTADGYTHSCTCTVCGKVSSGVHNAEGGEVTIPATCKEEGVWTSLCSTCGYIIYEVIPKRTEHTWDSTCDPDCNVCGETREVKHNMISGWMKNASGHWHACANKGCKIQFDFGKHFPGPAATEEEAQLCLTCGYTLTPKLNHEHDYAQTWTNDEEGHWYACSGCEEQKDFKPHDYDDPCDPDCNVCGYENGNAHTFDGSWHSDEEGHWFVCTTCGGVVEPKDHVAPDAAAEGGAVYCRDCGYLMAVAQDHTHSYMDIWLKDEGSHWQECECGEQSAPEAHKWDAGKAQEDGETLYKCSVCGAERTEEAPEEEKGEFPWGILFLVLIVALIGAVIALIIVLKPKKKGKFAD